MSRNSLVLSEAIMSHINRILSYLNAAPFLEEYEGFLSVQGTIPVYLENLTSLTINIANMGDY